MAVRNTRRSAHRSAPISTALILTALVISGPVACDQALAQGQLRTPSDAALAREQQRIEAERRGLFEDPRLHLPGLAKPPGLPAVPAPSPQGVDLESLARRYADQAKAPSREQLYVFASFTMPQASLKRLLEDAARAGAVVVFRGFKANSIKATSQALADFRNDRVNAVVHPAAFTQYKVASVPTVALVRLQGQQQLDAQGCALPHTFAAVSGDVTLDYALGHIARTQPAFAAIAAPYLQQLKGKP